MKLSSVKFSGQGGTSFDKEVRSRVEKYFKDNNLSKKGNNQLIVKFIVFFSLYFVPYGLFIFGVVTGTLFTWIMLVTMGIGLAGIGVAIMHDANHGSLSRKKWKNGVLKYTMNLIGASSINWRIQHNLLHHGFTNVQGLDTDIEGNAMLRFTPHAERKKIHKFQVFYFWALYGLMTINWTIIRDLFQLLEFDKKGLLKSFKTNIKKELPLLIASKIMYVSYMIVLPWVLTDFLFWEILIGFFVVHFIAGLILSIIFQTAHVVSEIDFPLPKDQSGKLDFSWAELQLKTTSNFATNSSTITWLVGGLNYQIEHHLFPEISHVHYRDISQIVQETALEFGLPYYDHGSFGKAIKSHLLWLHKMGQKETVQA